MAVGSTLVLCLVLGLRQRLGRVGEAFLVALYLGYITAAIVLG